MACFALRRRRTRALRALVVLPTRDLASQVYRVFARMCPGMGLTVGLMAGKASEVLYHCRHNQNTTRWFMWLILRRLAALSLRVRLPQPDLHPTAATPVGTWTAFACVAPQECRDLGGCLVNLVRCRSHSAGAAQSTEAAAIVGHGASAGADIAVATPGRLTAHLRGTSGFDLAALRFLVVDETDRLLRQAYQDWLPAVTAAIAAGGGTSVDPDMRHAPMLWTMQSPSIGVFDHVVCGCPCPWTAHLGLLGIHRHKVMRMKHRMRQNVGSVHGRQHVQGKLPCATLKRVVTDCVCRRTAVAGGQSSSWCLRR